MHCSYWLSSITVASLTYLSYEPTFRKAFLSSHSLGYLVKFIAGAIKPAVKI